MTTEMTGTCEAILRSIAADDIEALAAAYPDERTLLLDWQAVADEDEHVAQSILRSPNEMVDRFEAALSELHNALDTVDSALAEAHVRFENFPESETYQVGEQRARQLHDMIALEGQITKRTEVNPKLDVGVFVCQRCGEEVRVQQGYGKIREPLQCSGCDAKQLFVKDDERSEWVDHQVIRLQQPPEDAIDGATANIDVHLLDDLCGEIEGGQRATVIGRFEPVEDKGKTRHLKTIRGNAVHPEQEALEDYDNDAYAEQIEELANNDPFERLVASLAPGHEGDWHVKETLVLQLFGGWARTAPDGQYHRGDSHVYLLGDPGTGKSNLLNAVAKRAPRAAMTDGTGSSAAGLTASITRDDFGDSQWSIEAGTIVRANKGVAIVDELDKGDTSDLDALHTALESQEVLVSKGGRHAHLPAKAALLAAGNPTGGHFDPKKDFNSQVDLQSPLLSRFDVIFAVREKYQEDRVESVADHMVSSRQTAGRIDRDDLTVDEEELASVAPDIDTDLYSAYVAHARRTCRPVVRDDAVARALKEFYEDLKLSLPNRYTDDDGPPLPVTARKLDGLQRLAEASARTRLSGTIEMQDVKRASRPIMRSLADLGIEPGADASIGRTPDQVEKSEVGI